MSKVLRHKMVDDLADKLKGLKNMVLVDANGLTANQATELRAQMREGSFERLSIAPAGCSLPSMKAAFTPPFPACFSL